MIFLIKYFSYNLDHNHPNNGYSKSDLILFLLFPYDSL